MSLVMLSLLVLIVLLPIIRGIAVLHYHDREFRKGGKE